MVPLRAASKENGTAEASLEDVSRRAKDDVVRRLVERMPPRPELRADKSLLEKADSVRRTALALALIDGAFGLRMALGREVDGASWAGSQDTGAALGAGAVKRSFFKLLLTGENPSLLLDRLAKKAGSTFSESSRAGDSAAFLLTADERIASSG